MARKQVANANHLNIAKDVQPKTYPQQQMVDAYNSGLNVVAVGSAGSGKSFVACYLALKDLFANNKSKIVIFRSAVATRDVGHLPGTLDEKMDVYTIPYKEIINQLCENGTAWDILTKKEAVKFLSTSYCRGITLDDSVIIIDEVQSMNKHELYTLLSRVGENTQVIICGDTRQTDLNPRKEESCYDFLINVARKMPDFMDIVNFHPSDIVRGEFCKKLIMVVEDL